MTSLRAKPCEDCALWEPDATCQTCGRVQPAEPRESAVPEWVEIGWTDEDGDHGHVIVGDGLRSLGAADDVVARITVRGLNESVSHPVDLPRAHAETLHSALGRYLAAKGDQ